MRIIKSISYFVLISVIALTFGLGSSYASNYSKEKALHSVTTENDKIITNVKVFYNPIAEQISVSFKATKTSSVSIKVMDALGNEVMNLLNEDLEEGNQNLSFETDGKLSTGFYFVRVTSGSESVIKRISIR